MKKVDRIFLRTNCLESAKIRSELDFDAVNKDDFRGKRDQELYVITALSKCAVADLKERYGFSCKDFPAVLTHEGLVVEKTKNILIYLIRENMIRKKG